MTGEELMKQLEREYQFDVDAAVMELHLNRIGQYLGRHIVLEESD